METVEMMLPLARDMQDETTAAVKKAICWSDNCRGAKKATTAAK